MCFSEISPEWIHCFSSLTHWERADIWTTQCKYERTMAPERDWNDRDLQCYFPNKDLDWKARYANQVDALLILKELSDIDKSPYSNVWYFLNYPVKHPPCPPKKNPPKLHHEFLLVGKQWWKKWKNKRCLILNMSDKITVYMRTTFIYHWCARNIILEIAYYTRARSQKRIFCGHK